MLFYVYFNGPFKIFPFKIDTFIWTIYVVVKSGNESYTIQNPTGLSLI